MSCKQSDIKEWRTPNGEVFVAVCEVCGAVATSMRGGVVAFNYVNDKHRRREEQIEIDRARSFLPTHGSPQAILGCSILLKLLDKSLVHSHRLIGEAKNAEDTQVS